MHRRENCVQKKPESFIVNTAFQSSLTNKSDINTSPALLCIRSFFKGKGRNALIRLKPSIRSEMVYDTQEFKELYKKRTSVVRVFSGHLAFAMQHPTVRGYNANRNHATIAQISVLLVAHTEYLTGQQDKMRFVKSSVPFCLT